MKPLILTSTLAAALLVTASLQVEAQQPLAPPPPPPLGLPGAAAPVAPVSAPPGLSGAAPSALSAPVPISRAGPRADPSPSSVYAVKGSSAVPPLVIQFTPADANFVSNMEEDLAIMARLFEKTLDQFGETPGVSKMGIQMMLTAGGRSIRASYMEGFGALFMIKVNFPVVRATQTTEDKPAPATQSEWESAKRDLAKRGLSGDGSASWEVDAEWGQQYDPALVSSVTKSLVKSLNNAAHIRQLKPEEFIAITVFGSPAPPTIITKTAMVNNKLDGSDMPPMKVGKKLMFASSDMASPSRGTVLTLRVKRADVDALVKGELSPEQFETRISQHTYLGSGHGITSLNSWVQDAAPGAGALPSPGYAVPPRKR